jgi:23S rRNA pseudoU1915 N3-methylase RlmH
MERVRRVDLSKFSQEEQYALGERIGEKMRKILDEEVESFSKKMKVTVKFSYSFEESEEVFKKKRVSKKAEDYELRKKEQDLLERLNNISAIYGIKTNVTLFKE